MTRRTLLSATLAASALPAAASRFSFVHFTDLHIQPELHAAQGCAKAVARINALKPDFAISGGDLVFDAAEAGFPRAKQLFDLYAETLKPLRMPVHTVVGNHDVFGVSSQSGVPQTDAHYGKKMFEERIGPRYRSFQHQGWHFVLLDSIGTKQDGRDFQGWIDEEQMAWLKRDLAEMRPGTPLVLVTHVPLASGVLQLVKDPWKTAQTYLVGNAREVLELVKPYRPKAVLQGHTHIRETLLYDDCQFITSGAVCGNWWKGAREGHPEGFGVLTVTGQEIRWRYETYGFVAEVA